MAQQRPRASRRSGLILCALLGLAGTWRSLATPAEGVISFGPAGTGWLTFDTESSTNGQPFAEAAPIHLRAASDGLVTNVMFVADGQVIGHSWAPPFTVLYTNALPGTRELTAIAQGSHGHAVTSLVVRVNISPRLDFVRLNDTQMKLTWSYPSEGFQLQCCTTLHRPDWTPVTEPDHPTNDLHAVTVSLWPGTGFFQLAKP